MKFLTRLSGLAVVLFLCWGSVWAQSRGINPVPPSAPPVKPPTQAKQPAPVGKPTNGPAKVKPPTNSQESRKANARPKPAPTPAPEPFANATVEQMAGQCVTLETAEGRIEFEVFPEHAPVTVRSFLNLVASGALDTTTFSRVVKGFVIQGGNLSTSEKWDAKLAERANRNVPDEPNPVKHERGIVSMARPDTPNSASTHFFILLNTATSLDGTFAAFGRVRQGMDVVEKINNAPASEEKPEKPVRVNRATVAPCATITGLD